MAYPTSITGLVPVREDGDTAAVETHLIPGGGGTYQLGSGASPVVPWPVIPNGASPVPVPAAPTLTSQLTNARFGLTTTAIYKWWCVNVTRFGQTTVSVTPLTVTMTGSNNGVQLTLPAATSAAYNPVISRKLYRSVAGGSSGFFVADLDSVSGGVYTDAKADNELGDAAPSSDTSGISPSPVAVTAPGPITYTERPLGSSLTGHDYTVDYSVSPTGGTLAFAAADAGTTVTITYTAATDLGETFFNAVIAAVQDLYNNGPAHAVRQRLFSQFSSFANQNVVGTWTDLPLAQAITVPASARLTLRCTFGFIAWPSVGPTFVPVQVGLQFRVSGPSAYNQQIPCNAGRYIPGATLKDSITAEASLQLPGVAGAYTVTPQYFQNANALEIQGSDAAFQGIALTVEEYA